jgi:hypothetical protein
MIGVPPTGAQTRQRHADRLPLVDCLRVDLGTNPGLAVPGVPEDGLPYDLPVGSVPL